MHQRREGSLHGSSFKNSETHIFSIFLQAVKMKVKFPCRLTLEHEENVLTDEISQQKQDEEKPSSGNKFVINQQITLRTDTRASLRRDYFEVIVNLITEKGSKYIAGTIKLFYNELLRSQGERIIVSLSKCLDSEALCELKVQKIVTVQPQHRMVENPNSQNTNVFQSNLNQKNSAALKNRINIETQTNDRSNLLKNNLHERSLSPNVKFREALKEKNGLKEPKPFGTRSEAHFPTSQNIKAAKSGEWEDNHQMKQQLCAMTYYPKSRNLTKPSPPKTRRMGEVSHQRHFNGSSNRLRTLQDEQNTAYNRQKLIQAQVYKENYQKLKQKYRKQCENFKSEQSRRLNLENNENNYKLQIVRLRLKSEELDKLNSQKSQKLQVAQAQLAVFQQADIDVSYYKEEHKSAKQNISLLQDSIITLNSDNEKLRELLKDREHEFESKLQQIESEYQQLSQEHATKTVEFERVEKTLSEKLVELEYDLNAKDELVEKLKRHNLELQQSAHHKLYEFDGVLQSERNAFRNKNEQFKTKLEALESENKELSSRKQELTDQNEALKAKVVKSEYEFKLQLQDFSHTKAEIEKLQEVREKYHNQGIELKKVREEKAENEKEFEKNRQIRELQYEELMKERTKEIECLKRINADLNEKSKQHVEQVIQLEGIVDNFKASAEKSKKKIQDLTKDIVTYKEKQKALKNKLTAKQEEYDELKIESERANDKNHSLSESKKLQIQRLRQEIEKLRLQDELNQEKIGKLNDGNLQLSHEVERVKLMLKYSEEKNQKTSQSAHEKYQSYESIVAEHESVISMLEEELTEVKAKCNEAENQLNHLENANHDLSDKVQRFQKAEAQLQEKLQQEGRKMIQKLNEHENVLQKYSALISEKERLQSQNHELNLQLNSNRVEKEKALKMLSLAESESQKQKQMLNLVSVQAEEKDNQGQILTKKIKVTTEELQQTKAKLQNLQNEFEDFMTQYQVMAQTTASEAEAIHNQVMQDLERSSILLTQKQNTNRPIKAKTQGFESLSFQSRSQRTKRSDTVDFGDLSSILSNLIQNLMKVIRDQQQNMSILNSKYQSASKQVQALKGEGEQLKSFGSQREYEHEKEISQLEEELRLMVLQKNQQIMSLESKLSELNEQFNESQSIVSELQSQNDELQFTMSSNKMEYDAALNEYDKKNYQLKLLIEEIEDKNDFQHNLIASLEDKCYETEKGQLNINGVLMAQKQENYKMELTIKDLEKQIAVKEKQIQSVTADFKRLMEEKGSLEIEIQAEKQSKSKLEEELKQQQAKSKELKEFTANLIKEKENIIAKQLTLHQKVSNIENQLLEAEQHKQHLLEEIHSYKMEQTNLKKQIQDISLQLKAKINALENFSQQSNADAVKIKELQQKASQLESHCRSLESSSEARGKGDQKSIEGLNQEIVFLANQKQQISQSLSEATRHMESIQAKYSELVIEHEKQKESYEEALYEERQRLKESIDKLEEKSNQINELKYKVQQFEVEFKEIQEELRQKQESMYEMSGTIYELEAKSNDLLRLKDQQIEDLDEEWKLKYDEAYEEMDQRILLSEKEKQYLSDKLEQKERQLKKRHEDVERLEAELQKVNLKFNEKMKKIEEQRLSVLSVKNGEFLKQSQELHRQIENSKQQETVKRKLSHELQIARNQIQKLDTKCGEYDSKIKVLNRSYQQEMEEWRKNILKLKNERENFSNELWNCETSVRKALQNFIKSILLTANMDRQNFSSQGVDTSDFKQNFISQSKTLEQSILASINNVCRMES